MIELIGNIIQMIVICGCLIVVIYETRNDRSRIGLLYALFLTSMLLGDIWWILELLLYDETPYSLVPYLNWKAAYVFLILMMQQDKRVSVYRNPASRYLWGSVLFCAVMCVYYMQFGAYIDNVLTAVLMSVLIWIPLQRLTEIRKNGETGAKDEMLCRMVLLFCTTEYVMWTASCFDSSVRVLYDVFNFVLTACFILFIPAVRKAVGR